MLFAVGLGLPRLSVEGTDLDPCGDTSSWKDYLSSVWNDAQRPPTNAPNGDSFAQATVYRLLNDMCAWRRIAKGVTQPEAATTYTTLMAVSESRWCAAVDVVKPCYSC
jgi:hypothetical protein